MKYMTLTAMVCLLLCCSGCEKDDDGPNVRTEHITKFTLTSYTPESWDPFSSNPRPDVYFRIVTSDNVELYKSSIQAEAQPGHNVSLDTELVNSPSGIYTLQVWDDDVNSEDDLMTESQINPNNATGDGEISYGDGSVFFSIELEFR